MAETGKQGRPEVERPWVAFGTDGIRGEYGTEPLIRVTVEAPTAAEAQRGLQALGEYVAGVVA